MAEMLAITTLRAKRAEIADALEGLGRQVEQRRTDLMHLDGTRPTKTAFLLPV